MPPTDIQNDVEDTQDGQQPPATTREGLLEAEATDLLSEAFADVPTPDDDDAGDVDPDDDAAAEGKTPVPGEATKPPEASEAKPPARSMTDYVEMLALEPGRSTEVPEKVRADAVARANRLRESIAQQTARDIYDRVQRQQQAQEQLQEKIGAFIELHEEKDYEGLDALAKRDPGGAALFDAYLAQERAAAAGPPAPTMEQIRLKGQAVEAMRSFGDDAAARDRFMSGYTREKYPTTEEGLERLRADIKAAINPPKPERRATPEERSAAATARGRLPKVDASPGAPPPSGKATRKELMETSGEKLLQDALS